MVEAWLYDGRSAVRRGARVEAAEGAVRLVARSGEAVLVPTDRLTHVETRRGHEVFGHRDIAGWRLGVPAPLPDELRPLFPRGQVYGGWIDRIGLGRALLVGAIVSVAIVLAGSRAPDFLAPLVPLSWEREFGNALVGDLGARTCNDAEGRAALAKLTARLTSRHADLNVRVADIGMVNAVALPGGNIVIFKELLTEAQGPDEVAGVLAHEIAHVENRDVTRAMIRHFGLGILLTGFGGTTGANAETLLAADYSRAAESRADRDAVESLQRADISPAATARFFDRLSRMEQRLGRLDDAFSYISSHPQSSERRELFRGSTDRQRRYRPSLSDQEWRALQDICWTGPNKAEPVRPAPPAR